MEEEVLGLERLCGVRSTLANSTLANLTLAKILTVRFGPIWGVRLWPILDGGGERRGGGGRRLAQECRGPKEPERHF